MIPRSLRSTPTPPHPTRQRLAWLPAFAIVAVASLLAGACATTTSLSTGPLAPLSRGEPAADAHLAAAVARSPEDATWLQLEQAFTLLRHARSDADVARARTHLEAAFATFEDLRDPENLSVAFTADADTPYRGRPHERVLAATALALTDAAHGRCDLALPTLRAAEFLDVRWQRLAFGTDAAVVYALARWCLEQTSGRPEDKERAEDGLHLTLRFAAASEALRALVRDAATMMPRVDAVASALAVELAEMALLTTLANNPRARDAEAIVAAGLQMTATFMGRTEELLASPELAAALEAASSTAGDGMGRDQKAARAFVRSHLKPALDDLARALQHPPGVIDSRRAFAVALEGGARAADAALEQLSMRQVTFTFAGLGPALVREGQYQEVARMVPRDGAPHTPGLRRDAVDVIPGACGIRGSGQGFVAVLCGARGREAAMAGPADGLALWSSATQATTVVGRRFDAILKGRAVFKAGTESAARIAVWTASSLLEAGFDMLETCGAPTRDDRRAQDGNDNASPAAAARKRQRDNDACVAVALTTIAAGGVVAGVGGLAWLAGSAVNPAADPRFVDALPETVALIVPRGASADVKEAP